MKTQVDSTASSSVTITHEPFAGSQQELLGGLAYVDLLVRWAVARARAHGLDPDDEFRGLYISEDQIDSLLGYELGSLWPNPNGQLTGMEGWPAILAQSRQQWQSRITAGIQAGKSHLFSDLIRTFQLSPDEVDILLIALAPEIDPRYERLFAYLQDDVTRRRPSVDLVLNLLTDSFAAKLQKRRLLTDDGRLISYRLLTRYSDNASREPSLLGQYLRPAARVVEHLLNQPGLDEQLAGCAVLSFPVEPVSWLPEDLVKNLTQAVSSNPTGNLPPLFAFEGGYGVGKQAAAEHLAQTLDQPFIVGRCGALANSDLGLNDGLRLVLRDGRLLNALVYLTQWDLILEDNRPPSEILEQILDYPGVIAVGGENVWQPEGRGRTRRFLRVSFAVGDYEHRLQVWQRCLEVVNPEFDQHRLPLAQLANQFLFSPGQIEDVVATARDLAQWRREPLTATDLFVASRAHSNQKLNTLATKIAPRYRWEDIVLPKDTLAQLQEMVNTVRQRPVVYGQWGFDRKVALGKGLSALFAGESGTGKTMAADILAGELGQDLYKIDLSMLVSKYIGETEKNLNRVFSEAETSNAILFFDEADAIFGKRSEVKDSHDRYANIEISYLLQRMEAYDGVVILASNLRGNLDEAFTRRLHFIVEFPFPEVADREIIWQVNFPPETPLAEDVDFRLLARRFRITGGNIRNIIMAAAFLAAEKSERVSMAHLLHATRREYQKIGRLIDDELFILGD
jgi:DNA polymerase III delta prime subunit